MSGVMRQMIPNVYWNVLDCNLLEYQARHIYLVTKCFLFLDVSFSKTK